MKFSWRSGSGPPGIGARIFISLFFLAFLAMGSFFVWMVGRGIVDMARAWTWREVECRIVESRVEQRISDPHPFVFQVRYRYDFGGRQYEGTTYRPSFAGSREHRTAQRLADRYPADSRAVCYVDPKNPQRSCLSRPRPWGAFLIFLPLIFVAVGAGGIYATWRGRKTGSGQPGPRAISKSAVSPQKAAGCLVLFFAVFFLAGAGTFLFFAIPAFRILAARSWRPTPCVVLSSEVRSHRGDDSTTYSVAVDYEYEVAGRTYRSGRYQFLGGSSGGYDSKSAIVAANPPGARCTCYVNPEDPWDSVLTRSFSKDYLVALVPLLFLAVGLGGILFTLRNMRRTRAAGETGFGAPGGFSFAQEESASPVILKTSGPVPKFLGMTVVAVFWNGIVAVFLSQVVKGWRGGQHPWGLTLFLVPFVLVGLLMIAGVFSTFLATFNPRVRVTASRRAIPLGGAATLEWKFTGAAWRIQRVEIVAEGREEATYRRGTDTHTDRERFATIPVYAGAGVTAGTATLTIPEETMHSFAAPNNRIVWTLKLRGEIPNWPDVSQDFDLDVRPKR